MMRRILLAALTCAVLGPGARAQPVAPQDEAYDLASIEADHEICGFALSDEQQEVIAQRRDALVTKGEIAEAEIAAVQEQVSAASRRQKADGLCRPDGAEAKAYRRRLTGLGLP